MCVYGSKSERKNHGERERERLREVQDDYEEELDKGDDLFCTTPRLCQKKKKKKKSMTHVALRGRGTTSAYKCFPATGMFSS